MARIPLDIDLTNDRALLDAYRRGDAWALKKIYGAHVSKVAKIVLHGFHFNKGDRMLQFTGVSSRFDLEAVVQDVFTRLFLESTRLRYDGLRPFEGYVVGITRNTCIDWFRAGQAAQNKRRAEKEAGNSAPTVAGQWQAIEASELGKLLDDFAERLNDRERMIMKRRLRDQEAQEEVSREIGITRIRLRRIEAKIKRDLFTFLKKHGYFAGREPPESSLLQDDREESSS